MGMEDINFDSPEFDAHRLALESTPGVKSMEFVGFSGSENVCAESPDERGRHVFMRIDLEDPQLVQIIQCAHCPETFYD